MMLLNLKIDQILQKAGFHGYTISSIGNGHYNDSYCVDLDKSKYVLRIAPPDCIPKLFYEIDIWKSFGKYFAIIGRLWIQ